jgi:hypothetical protein
MRCPHCGEETPDEEWNCVSCRINLYWATQHHGELAGIRARQGLTSFTETPTFLMISHRHEMDSRASRGGRVEHKVRKVARLFMRRRPGTTRDHRVDPEALPDSIPSSH